MTPPPMVTIENVTKRFGDVVAVDDVSIDIRPNEFFALLGPFRLRQDHAPAHDRRLRAADPAAALTIDGEDMTRTVPPNRRPVNMVFQSYAVFPHMSVADNVAYGLTVTGTCPGPRSRPRVEEALKMVRLEGYGSSACRTSFRAASASESPSPAP